MKISNETKIGALTIISVALLILGFNFLKGKSIFKSGDYLYARYANIKGLAPSNPVYINGFQIGAVSEVESANKTVTAIMVTIKLKEPFNIPDNSVASINSNPLGSPSIEIDLGNSPKYYDNNDTIMTTDNPGVLGTITNKLAPVADQVTATLHSLDSLLKNFNTVLDQKTKGNLQSVIGNLSSVTAALVSTTASVNKMLDAQNGALGSSLNNFNSFTKNLADNNATLTRTLNHVDTLTGNLAHLDLDSVMRQLNSATAKLDSAMTAINSTNGSIGALLYDREIYNNLNNTVVSLHTLTDDLRVHPKRYVNISVFGKKDKKDYITKPLNEQTKPDTLIASKDTILVVQPR